MTSVSARLQREATARVKIGVDGASQRWAPVARNVLARKIRGLTPKMWEVRFAAALPKGRLAVDVGAHIGLMSMVLASRFERVVALEPNPTCVTRLRTTMPSNVAVVAAAAADLAGLTELHVPRHSGRSVAALGSLVHNAASANETTYTVPSLRLDDMDLGPVEFLKIDVEGFEPEVIAGATATLQNRPVVLLEAEERHRAGVVGQLTASLGDFGLSGLFVSSGQVHPMEDFDPTAHQLAVPTIDGVIPPGYAANFVFAPSEDREHWRVELARAVSST